MKDVAGGDDQSEDALRLVWRLLTTPLKVVFLAYRARIDVVHINPTFDHKSLVRDGLILLALRAVRFKRVLVYFHGWSTRTETFIRQRPGLSQLLTWLLNGTAHVMVLSPEFQKTLADMGVRSGLIATTRTMFDSTGYHLAEGCLPDPERPFVLFMSRFEHEKGVYELMEAFARIADDYPALTLVMAGDGKEMSALKAKAAGFACRERIDFPGYVNGLEKWKLLRTCAIFALPTSWGEGMPVSLLEAMSVGKPLLTTKAGGIKYIIADPDNGVVLDAVTVDAVEAALRFLLDNPYYCHGIGQRNAEYAWRCFGASHVTGEIEAVYRTIAGMAAINTFPSPVPALSHEG